MPQIVQAVRGELKITTSYYSFCIQQNDNCFNMKSKRNFEHKKVNHKIGIFLKIFQAIYQIKYYDFRIILL